MRQQEHVGRYLLNRRVDSMKFRSDFVTNSSSSSFIVEKYITLVFDESENEYTFGISKENNKTTDTDVPHDFAKYVNWHYLFKGTKPSVNKMLSGKGLNGFADYLIQSKKESGTYHVINEETDYNIGYGESEGDDIRDSTGMLISHLHPAIREYYSGKSLYGEIIDSKDFKIDWIERNKIINSKSGDEYYFRFIYCRQDYTLAFYSFLYLQFHQEHQDHIHHLDLSDDLHQDIPSRYQHHQDHTEQQSFLNFLQHAHV